MVILQLLATIFMIGMNTIAEMLPLNGIDTKFISDQLHTIITPAGFTFSIWSIIYIGMIAVSVALVAKKITLPRKAILWYIISCLANGGRIVAWHYGNLHLSMLIILVLLISLIVIDRTIVAKNNTYKPRVRNAFLVYFGRVQIATLVMTTIYAQYQLGILSGITLQAGIAVLILAGVVNLYVLLSQRHAATTLVACRALRGIINGQTNHTIVMTAYGVLIALVVSMLIFFLPAYIKSHQK